MPPGQRTEKSQRIGDGGVCDRPASADAGSGALATKSLAMVIGYTTKNIRFLER